MTTLQHVLLFTHLLGLAAIIGGYFAVIKDPRPTASMLWGSRWQLLSGLAMVGVAQSQGWTISTTWMIVKLAVAVIVAGLLEVAAGMDKKGERSAVLVQVAAGLTAINIAVAIFWR